MEEDLRQYRNELHEELKNILAFWVEYTLDNKYGGFVGRVDHSNSIDYKAAKGSVLNSRILWAFSAAYNLTGNERYLEIASRAYNYYSNNFIDKQFGGVYWSLDFTGKPLDDKKQIYALAFAVYGLTEYYKATKDQQSKDASIGLYNNIVNHSLDTLYGGYIEALTRDWRENDDLRLSEKDANERKSMNTHLHVLECFSNLYSIWPDKLLKERLVELINIFLHHIIDKNNNHLILFFDDEWHSRSDLISYGHDIESAWLLQEAAEITGDNALIQKIKSVSIKITEAATEGIDKDGGLWYEYQPSTQTLVSEKHSWPQAEAMIGFFNAWQNTKDSIYYQRSKAAWQFVQHYIKDDIHGEWYWGIKKDYTPMVEKDKVGIWKCPYHNSRACIEIIRRINKVLVE